MTLARYITNNKKGYKKDAGVHRVVTDTGEVVLAKHIKDVDDGFYGHSKDRTRTLAHEYATANKVKMPKKLGG